MHKFRSRLIAALCAAAVAVPLFGPAAPAGAVPIGNGCIGAAVPAAHIGWFPAQPAAMSTLKVSCAYNNNTGTSQVSPTFTIHDHNMSLWHNGGARTVTNSVAAIAGATTIQLNTASNGIAGLPVTPTAFNRVISGPGIGVRTHVTSMTAGGLITLNKPTTGAVPVSSSLKIEIGNARSVTDATQAVAGTDLLNSASASFATSTDVGCSVSGTGVPANTTILAVNSASQVQLSTTYTLGGGTVTFCGTAVTSTTRQITGANITSAVRMTSTVAGFTVEDVSLKVVGVCDQGTIAAGDDYTIPANVYVLTRVNATTIDTTGGLTFPQTGCNFTLGDPSATAPANGEVVVHQGVQLDLDPGFVLGSGACADEQPEGFAIVGKWNNPGSFFGSGVVTGQPGRATAYQPAFPTAAIGQILWDTSVADFASFVLAKRAASSTPLGADPIGVAHNDIMTPFAPTTAAMCASTATSTGLLTSLSVFASTTSQSTLPTGTGRPGTGQLRSTLSDADGNYNSTVFVRSDDAAVTYSPATDFQRLCVYAGGLPNAPGFQCGPG